MNQIREWWLMAQLSIISRWLIRLTDWMARTGVRDTSISLRVRTGLAEGGDNEQE